MRGGPGAPLEGMLNAGGLGWEEVVGLGVRSPSDT